MSRDDCEICRGRGEIVLPRYRPVKIGTLAEMTRDHIDVEANASRCPCPECSTDVVPFTRLCVEKGASGFASDDELKLMREAMVRQAAYMMIDRFISLGLVQVEERERFQYGRRSVQMLATMAVVAPKDVAMLESRVSERQFEVASELVAATAEEIANWGSYYHGRDGGSVSKWQALEWLQTAFKKVKSSRGIN